MVNLVKDLLVLSQLDYSQMEWHKTEVDLGELAREVREQLLRKWGSEAAPIKVEMPEMLPVVWADKERIRQVFVNLLNNALKYTPPEGEITVSAGLEAGLIKVLVADTGVGIPPEDLPHLFERFYRVEKTRSRNYGGTGLGLSIARKIVRPTGGKFGWRASRERERGSGLLYLPPKMTRGEKWSREREGTVPGPDLIGPLQPLLNLSAMVRPGPLRGGVAGRIRARLL